MRRLFLTIFIIAIPLLSIFSQGLNIPAKNWGLSFGNSTRFDGIGFNLIDKDIDKINGINFNVWGAKDDSRHTATVNGISIGIPSAMGTNCRNGINIGGLGVGAGGHVKGISVSAFNHIEGDVFGVCIGVFNWAYAIRGFQPGILNHVKSNPKGLRWLPIFNTSFGA